jgi:uncharacterized membrane protein
MEVCIMTGLEWILASSLFFLYFFLLFTVCFMTFQKGYVLLGIVGIFIPFLWLIGAILPAKQGSKYEVQQAMRYQSQTGQLTS